MPDEEIPDCQRTKEEEMYRLFRSLRELELFGLAVSYICLFRYVFIIRLGCSTSFPVEKNVFECLFIEDSVA